MSQHDFPFGERLMQLRVEEEQRQAEMHRLQKEAGGVHQGWLSRQRCLLLCQLGRLFGSLGVWLWERGQWPVFPQETPADTRA
jgi:hypothetical protein